MCQFPGSNFPPMIENHKRIQIPPPTKRKKRETLRLVRFGICFPSRNLPRREDHSERLHQHSSALYSSKSLDAIVWYLDHIYQPFQIQCTYRTLQPGLSISLLNY